MDRRTTIGLAVIFALLLLYVFMVQKPQEAVQANSTATAQASQNKTLWDFPAENVVAVRVMDLAKARAVAFEKNSTGWVVTQPYAGRADDVLVERAVANFRKLYVIGEFPDAVDLAQFGLDKPLYSVEIRMLDGTSLSLTIGSKTLTESGFYALPRGETTARVLTYTAVGDAITTLLDAPPFWVPTATPTEVAPATVDLSKLGLPTATPGITGTPAAPTATPAS